MKIRTLTVLLTALGVAATVSPTHAQTLTSVPMQGGMVMPMVGYDADLGALYVTVDPTVPQLTPLLASNPGADFDPADPWYDCLDPHRQGLAFSRRYGFTMDAMTDLLPADTAIWIRKVSSSPGIGFYNYRSSVPKSWAPIFGTSGATNTLQWNGMMFHPGVAAPAGTNVYTATFEAFLAGAESGAEIPGTATGPFVLTWTNTPDGRPPLNVGLKVVITWPGTATNWVLETADTLSSTNWMIVTNAPTVVDGQRAVVPDSNPQGFYRMRLMP